MNDTITYFNPAELAEIGTKYNCVLRNICSGDEPPINTEVSNERMELYNKTKKEYTEKLDYSKVIEGYNDALLSQTVYFDKYKMSYLKCKHTNKKLLTLKIKKGTYLFKGTPYFENDLIGSNYYWFGNETTACAYAQRYQGGLIVMKNAKRLKLLVINKSNIQHIYDTILDTTIKRAFNLKYGIGCTLLEQISLMMDYAGWKDDVWIYNERSISQHFNGNIPKKWNMYGAGMNDRIVHNYIYSWIEKNMPEIDGTFIEKYFTPFCTMYSEEITLKYPCAKIFIDDTHKLHWKNWIKNNDLIIPDDFHLNINFRSANLKWNAIKYYNLFGNKQFVFSNRKYMCKVCTYNVHYLNSPNLLTDAKECLARLSKMIIESQFDIWTIQEFPAKYLQELISKIKSTYVVISTLNGCYTHQHKENDALMLLCIVKNVYHFKISMINYKTKKHRNSICVDIHLTKYDMIRTVVTHLENGRKYSGRDGGFLDVTEFLNNFDNNVFVRKLQLKALLAYEPDIIAGDLNFCPYDPECMLLEKYDIEHFTKNIRITNIYNKISDYVILKKGKYTSQHKIIPYAESDHLPVVCLIETRANA